jgi:hypothetical protein
MRNFLRNLIDSMLWASDAEFVSVFAQLLTWGELVTAHIKFVISAIAVVV